MKSLNRRVTFFNFMLLNANSDKDIISNWPGALLVITILYKLGEDTHHRLL